MQELRITSFYKKFSFLNQFLMKIGDDQAHMEEQLKDFYPQELINLSKFIGDSELNTTFFL